MRVFMLGWEFPPFISGGLGTACYGLTRALGKAGVQVTFVLPKAIGGEFGSHVKLLSPQTPRAATVKPGQRTAADVASSYMVEETVDGKSLEHVEFKAVPSTLLSPYQAVRRTSDARFATATHKHRLAMGLAPEHGEPHGHWQQASEVPYAGDLFEEARRYAALCVDLARGQKFDVVHAHDWLTFPAGLAVAEVSGKPLVVHVHSTEHDRAGSQGNPRIMEIERQGVHGAARVIAVSVMTRSILQHQYNLHPDRVDVVYNGVDNGVPIVDHFSRAVIRKGDKIVLFLGRITMQKGPEYFIAAARKVLDKFPHVKFVMAGSGDMVDQVMQLAHEQELDNHILFTGFLHGKDVEKVFDAADVYVMPSVSEPFGIAPLEAISHDVPVIISKQSGVSEVLQHALKVDFWDTDEMANKILAVLRHPPLGATLRQHADIEVRRLTWADAADKCVATYRSAIAP